MIAALLYLAFVVAITFMSATLLAQLRTHQQRTDPALRIKPPRQYKDDDGRSDFRPELRLLAEARRRKGA